LNSPNYRASGVDVRLGDEASRMLFEAARSTWVNRQGRFGEIKTLQAHFRTARYFDVQPVSATTCLGSNFDGIGTKIELAERLETYDGLAHDLLAMVCDDAAVQGAEPVHVGSVLDTAKVDLKIVEQVAVGLVGAAADAQVAIINGELAELPGRISGYGSSPLNWNAACFWAADREKLKSWSRATGGDVVVGVAERFAAQPSIIYSRFLLSLTGGLTGAWTAGLRGIIHVTGGGLLGRALYYCHTNGVRLRIGDDLRPPQPMRDICELGGVNLDEAYRTWNMGIGLLIS
jgi:phosphoribosylformylglycinamidine cyclo-ligase